MFRVWCNVCPLRGGYVQCNITYMYMYMYICICGNWGASAGSPNGKLTIAEHRSSVLAGNV